VALRIEMLTPKTFKRKQIKKKKTLPGAERHSDKNVFSKKAVASWRQ
jgi:hypothetical protein